MTDGWMGTIRHVAFGYGSMWYQACDGARWDTYIYITMGVGKGCFPLYTGIYVLRVSMMRAYIYEGLMDTNGSFSAI